MSKTPREETRSEKCRRASLSRKKFSGGPGPGPGRPRDPVRCPCGENSLCRATARGFACCRKAGLDPR